MEPCLMKKNIVEYINLEGLNYEYHLEQFRYNPNIFSEIKQEEAISWHENKTSASHTEGKVKKGGRKINLEKGEDANAKGSSNDKEVKGKQGKQKKKVGVQSKAIQNEEEAIESTSKSHKGKKKEKKAKEKEKKNENEVENKNAHIHTSSQSQSQKKQDKVKQEEDILQPLREQKQEVSHGQKGISIESTLRWKFLSKYKCVSCITKEVITSLFSLIKGSFPSEMKKLAAIAAYNIKEASLLIDNMCEISLGRNNHDIVEYIVENALEHVLWIISNGDSALIGNDAIKHYFLSVFYIVNKYQIETKKSILTTKASNLALELQKCLVQVGSQYLHCLTDTDTATHTDKDKDTSIKLKVNENLSLLFLLKALLGILLASGQTTYDMINDENLKSLITQIEKKIELEKIYFKNHKEDRYYDNFFNDYENLSFFTHFSQLLEANLARLSVITKNKTTKAINECLDAIQYGILRNNDKLFTRLINIILVRFIQNFDFFCEVNEKLYEDLFNLIKLISDEKLFSTDYINEIFESREMLQLKDIEFTSHDSDSEVRYITFIMKYLKYFQMNQNPELFLFYFNQVLNKVGKLKRREQLEKYVVLLHQEIQPYIAYPLLYQLVFSQSKDDIEKLLNSHHHLLKNVLPLKQLIKFYSSYPNLKSQIIVKICESNPQDNLAIALLFILYMHFIDLNSPDDKNLLQSLSNSKDFLENNFLIDTHFCSVIMKNTIDEELTTLEKVRKFIVLSREDSSRVFLNILLDKLSLCNLHHVDILQETVFKMYHAGLLKVYDIAFEKNFIHNITILGGNNKPNEILSLLVDSVLLEFLMEIFRTEGYESTTYEEALCAIREYCRSYTHIPDFLKEECLKKTWLLQSLTDMLPFMIEIFLLDRMLKIRSNSSIGNISETVNPSIVLESFIKYFDLIDTHRRINTSYNSEIILFNISIIKECVLIILQNDFMLSFLIQEESLWETFIKKYVGVQNMYMHMHMYTPISSKTEIISSHDHFLRNLNWKINSSTMEFIYRHCTRNFINLFSECEMYRMLLNTDHQFLAFASNLMSDTYKTLIISEWNIPSLLKIAQNEDDDLLEELVQAIFSKEVIEYLEYPQPVVDLLSKMNEALEYDESISITYATSAQIYSSEILPYFYIWKTLISKIRYGFNIRESEEKYDQMTIERYKTLLRYIVSYLEKNTKLYDMFLLLITSLMQFEEKDKTERDVSNTEVKITIQCDQPDNNDGNSVNALNYNFLKSILVNFVKIFPSLVQSYYAESKSKKLRNVFQNLIIDGIRPLVLADLKKGISENSSALEENNIKRKEIYPQNIYRFAFTYEAIEEIEFDLEIKIPALFPLKKLETQIESNMTIDSIKFKNLEMTLTNQVNASIDRISDNLILWAEDVNLFITEGKNPCGICYTYIHPTDKSLAGCYCNTCRNRYHSLCINGWFSKQSSVGRVNTCPMCRAYWK